MPGIGLTGGLRCRHAAPCAANDFVSRPFAPSSRSTILHVQYYFCGSFLLGKLHIAPTAIPERDRTARCAHTFITSCCLVPVGRAFLTFAYRSLTKRLKPVATRGFFSLPSILWVPNRARCPLHRPQTLRQGTEAGGCCEYFCDADVVFIAGAAVESVVVGVVVVIIPLILLSSLLLRLLLLCIQGTNSPNFYHFLLVRMGTHFKKSEV